MKLLFLDLETTGFSPDFACILEIAAIVVETEGYGGQWKMENYFHQYIHPYNRISRKITEINGITNAMVKNCKDEKTVLLEFLTWISGNEYDQLRPFAHNGNFDFRFLVGRLEKYNFDTATFAKMQSRLIDTLPIARRLIKNNFLHTEGGKATQEAIAKALDIQYHAHNALEDTKALVSIVKKLNELGGFDINDD